MNAETSRVTREGWTQEEREHFDAGADHEQWVFAASILEPWVQATRAIGHDELTQVMEEALAKVEGEVERARGVLERLESN